MEGDFVESSDHLALGYCVKGVRSFCKMHGLDYRDFVHKKMPAKSLLDTGDYMAAKVVEFARNRRK